MKTKSLYDRIEALTALKPNSRVKLAQWDPARVGDFTKSEAAEISADNLLALDELAYRLNAEHKRSLLVVLQGTDTAGKDGVVKHVMCGLNPQCAQVVSFKTPTEEERSHDFLWRVHKQVPARGNVCVFNRSHYEDVLIVRVDELVPRPVWEARYDVINHFESLISDGGTRVLKFFLHISREKQLKRLKARLKDPLKTWKFNKEDLDKRKQWDDYQAAYEDMLSKCNTAAAPWFVIPADHKWFRDLAIGAIIRRTLKEMDPQFPAPDPSLEKLKLKLK